MVERAGDQAMSGPAAVPRARLAPGPVAAVGRERVDRLLDRAWESRLTLVVAPAGSGKTTAAAQLVQRRRPAAWYRTDSADADPRVLLGHLHAAVGAVLPVGPRPWTDVDEMVVELDGVLGEGHLLVVVDELDTLAATEGERLLEPLAEDGPLGLHVLALSRTRPALNLSRLQVRGALAEIGQDQLRFRTWEIEHLFRDLYGVHLPHDELAELERRTGGWVAGLQLFHLATRGRPPGVRRAALARIGRRAGPGWEYLAQNVLAALPSDLREFLLDTVPLRVLTPELCDAVRGRGGSLEHLGELERRQLFTTSLDAGRSFGTHEVLRSHLESLLAEAVGEEEVRRRYRRAGELLEERGEVTEAVAAYGRGEAWEAVARLLERQGADVAEVTGDWLARAPAHLVGRDPWLQLLAARRDRAEGRLRSAAEAYQEVERRALAPAVADAARRERLVLSSLLDPAASGPVAWVVRARDAVRRTPMAAALVDAPARHEDRFVAGLAALLAGAVGAAATALDDVTGWDDVPPAIALGGGLVRAVARHLGGLPPGDEPEQLQLLADAVAVPWLTRATRAVTGLLCDEGDLARDVVGECERAGDAPGAALAGVLAALADLWTGAGDPRWTAGAAERCRALDAGTLETWLRAVRAAQLVLVGSPEGPGAAALAEGTARRRGIRGAQAVALAALARVGGHDAEEQHRLAVRVASECGLALPAALAAPLLAGAAGGAGGDDAGGHGPGPVDDARPAAPAVQVRCLGGFDLAVDGAPVDLSGVRPRAQAALRLLAARAGRPVHRDVLCEALWPEEPPGAATRKLHVAVSSLRRALEPDVGRGEWTVLRRDGDRYVLHLPPGSSADVVVLEEAVAAGRAAAERGDGAAAEAEFSRALDAYRGDLLPGDGAAEWVVSDRERARVQAVDAAVGLAELRRAAGDHAGVVRACERGLAVDRFRDHLWRLLLAATTDAGDPAAHAVATRRYREVLAELGVAEG